MLESVESYDMANPPMSMSSLRAKVDNEVPNSVEQSRTCPMRDEKYDILPQQGCWILQKCKNDRELYITFEVHQYLHTYVWALLLVCTVYPGRGCVRKQAQPLCDRVQSLHPCTRIMTYPFESVTHELQSSLCHGTH